MSSDPLVSLGVPVFNGENFLKQALDSILCQTLSDFEIIICDNASTDATEEICRGYTARDKRIKYYRNTRNLGSAPNCNLAFRHAKGRYFKWACHDDILAPDFLEKTVALLESNPDAVLCHSLVEVIDSGGAHLDLHDSNLVDADSDSVSVRFATMSLQPHQCLELDGVMRTDALARTSLVPSYAGGDRALLCELALLGKLLHIEEPIFLTREHPARFRRIANSPEARLAFYDTSRKGQKSLATWELYAGAEQRRWRALRRFSVRPSRRA